MVGYNRYPDEKGTERKLRHHLDFAPCPVTTATPMKRGLKGDFECLAQFFNNSYNRYPDEKGTESDKLKR